MRALVILLVRIVHRRASAKAIHLLGIGKSTSSRNALRSRIERSRSEFASQLARHAELRFEVRLMTLKVKVEIERLAKEYGNSRGCPVK
jgi:hypothetical protein